MQSQQAVRHRLVLLSGSWGAEPHALCSMPMLLYQAVLPRVPTTLLLHVPHSTTSIARMYN